MLNEILFELEQRLASIGSNLFQNYKLDYHQKVNYIKFITLLAYKNILEKMINGNVNYTHYSYDRDRILETIKTAIVTR